MASRTRRVVFGRINRRDPGQETLERRTFKEDVSALAQSHATYHLEESTAGRPMRRWMAADMALTPGGDFLTGVLGFSEQQLHRRFDDEHFSWMKAEVQDADAANEQTLAPFALDLRDGHRWLAFATTARLQAPAFRIGLETVINEAVGRIGLMPTAWEVDLVTSRSMIERWLTEHPLVHHMKRTLKFTNPGRNLDDDRAEMRALGARRKTEEFVAPPRGVLDTSSEQFLEKLSGTDTGDLDVVLKARGPHGVTQVVFNSRKSHDETSVEDFGTDLQMGVDIVLRALREYVSSKSGPEQAELGQEG